MKGFVVLCTAATLVGAACANSDNDLAATPTAAVTQASQAVCEARDEVVDLVKTITASPAATQADLVTQLGQLQTRLDSQADQLETSGEQQAADQVRAVADAVGQLEQAVSSQDPNQVTTAVGNLTTAAGQIALCAEPT